MFGRWFRRLLTLVLLLLVTAALVAWTYAQRVLPQAEGRLVLPGAKAPLQILRDANGIPTIRAASVRDAMYGLGVAHAQDRLWQMETHRRIGAGRLAEAFGEAAVDTDRFLRVLGVRRVAAAQWAAASPASREALQAYADGVNAVISNLRARPPEFLVLGLQPEAWTPEDSLAWAIMMAWDLGANWHTELIRLRLALKMPQARIDQLLPPYPGDPVPKTMDYAAFYRGLKLDGQQALAEPALLQLLAIAPESGIEGTGSNSWVLAGSRTTTGKPLLANDPHLKLSTPALWYFARLEAPGLDVAGATMPGLPGVVVGQNQRIAWGFTNTGPDVQDTYLERIHPDDPAQYQTPTGWARFEARQEVIRVKGRPDVTMTVRSTRHGPVLSDAVLAGLGDDSGSTLGPKAKPAYAVALRWTGLDTDNDIIATSLQFNMAGSVDAFIAASRSWRVPMQNMAVADADGRIALVSPGRVPQRAPDNDLQGLAPAPGWEARYDWTGFIPEDAVPLIRDPASGHIANANQRVTLPDYPHFITHHWALPFRFQRIEQLIAAQPTHSLADLGRMHGDVKSLAVVQLLPRLQKAQSAHPLAAAAQAQLASFDGTMAADKAAPLIYWAWHRHLTQQVLTDELGAPLYDRLLGQRGYFDALEGVLASGDAWWCDDKATPAAETCAQQIDRAFSAALDELQAAQGADVAAWQWGKAHIARSEHRPFSKVKPLARWFEVRTPVGGDSYTVNVSRVSLKADGTTGEYYLSEHGASLRGLYDLADRANSRVVHSTGQSGIPWSPLFRHWAEPWRRVEGVPLFVPASALVQTLAISPAP
ncbi:penicillin acylase family protein [Pseudaquabacterium pictum]|uniref:Penicillin acylase family protein n=1 Tax=Pseudaquabacterium pictum TaxID=2315236 RepID=A0A480AK45_9BURK|nr:penicillin acylase family protein [Rubrivivax pictus]GCL61911.1 penicillin acylase family protein [Rubrivivax pictus]